MSKFYVINPHFRFLYGADLHPLTTIDIAHRGFSRAVKPYQVLCRTSCPPYVVSLIDYGVFFKKNGFEPHQMFTYHLRRFPGEPICMKELLAARKPSEKEFEIRRIKLTEEMADIICVRLAVVYFASLAPKKYNLTVYSVKPKSITELRLNPDDKSEMPFAVIEDQGYGLTFVIYTLGSMAIFDRLWESILSVNVMNSTTDTKVPFCFQFRTRGEHLKKLVAFPRGTKLSKTTFLEWQSVVLRTYTGRRREELDPLNPGIGMLGSLLEECVHVNRLRRKLGWKNGVSQHTIWRAQKVVFPSEVKRPPFDITDDNVNNLAEPHARLTA